MNITFTDTVSGQEIKNPFYDSTLRFQVDPIKVYEFKEMDTGGGCKALVKELDNGDTILLTDQSGVSIPKTPIDDCNVMISLNNLDGIPLSYYTLDKVDVLDTIDLLQQCLNDENLELFLETTRSTSGNFLDDLEKYSHGYPLMGQLNTLSFEEILKYKNELNIFFKYAQSKISNEFEQGFIMPKYAPIQLDDFFKKGMTLEYTGSNLLITNPQNKNEYGRFCVECESIEWNESSYKNYELGIVYGGRNYLLKGEDVGNGNLNLCDILDLTQRNEETNLIANFNKINNPHDSAINLT